MAIMIPDKPKEFEVNSHEDLMFEALATLPDTYYVFHSYKPPFCERHRWGHETFSDKLSLLLSLLLYSSCRILAYYRT